MKNLPSCHIILVVIPVLDDFWDHEKLTFQVLRGYFLFSFKYKCIESCIVEGCVLTLKVLNRTFEILQQNETIVDGSLLYIQEVVLILVHKTHGLTLQNFWDRWFSRGLFKKITHSMVLLKSLQLLFNEQLKCLGQLFSAILQIIHHEVVRVRRRWEFEFSF